MDKKGKSNNHFKKGSYTIEAVVLVPMIFTIIVLCIYLSFYLLNREVITQNCYISALRGSLTTQENQMESEADTTWQELGTNRILAMNVAMPEITVSGKNITVKYLGNMQIPTGTMAIRILSKTGWNIEVTKTAKRWEPVSFIRNAKKLENVTNQYRSSKED